MNLAHIHLLLNHFPTIGFILGVGLFVVGLFGKSGPLQRASFVVLLGIALLTIPTYVSGNGAQEAICPVAPDQPDTPCPDKGVSRGLIQAHEGAALVAMAFMEIVGALAWLALWQYRRVARVPRWNLAAVLVFSIATFLLMARASTMGGEIRHAEIRDVPAATTVAEPVAREVSAWVTDHTWVWPACETLHFIGLCLLFGIATVVDLRMLGLIKNVSFPALHRLLPWGILGFGVNLVTGMLFFVGEPGQYTQNGAFHWKIVLMMLAGLNVLYFTVFDEPWAVDPGDDAPLTAKLIAASAILLVFGVMFCGRMLPFLGNSF